MISNDTKFGYEKILGLRGDRTGQKKRSLEARADAFSRLKTGLNKTLFFVGFQQFFHKVDLLQFDEISHFTYYYTVFIVK